MHIHEVYPYLHATDAEAAIEFYKKAFGATEKFRLVEPGGRIGHVELLFGETTVMLSAPFPELGIHAADPDGPCTFLVHLHVDDADRMMADAVAAGGRIVTPVGDRFWGERSGRVRDPFGYEWMIGHSIEEISPEEMQSRYERVGLTG